MILLEAVRWCQALCRWDRRRQSILPDLPVSIFENILLLDDASLVKKYLSILSHVLLCQCFLVFFESLFLTYFLVFVLDYHLASFPCLVVNFQIMSSYLLPCQFVVSSLYNDCIRPSALLLPCLIMTRSNWMLLFVKGYIRTCVFTFYDTNNLKAGKS